LELHKEISMSTGKATEALGFEAALEKLERSVEELEGGELGLDGALAEYEQGVRLLAYCRGLLDGAERRVALLTGLDDSGGPETSPFDVTATLDRESSAPDRRAPAGKGDGAPPS
jgi:exodeoxyribonuclease VII small subunit